MLIAARALDLGNGVRREIGDPVPEARSWRNLRNYIAQHWVLSVEEGLTLEELDTDTQVRVRRLGIAPKLIGLGILRGSGDAPVKTVAEVGQEIANGARITTGEIATSLGEVAAPEPAVLPDEPTPPDHETKRLFGGKKKKAKR